MRVVALVGGGNKMSAGCFACHKFFVHFYFPTFRRPTRSRSKPQSTRLDNANTAECQALPEKSHVYVLIVDCIGRWGCCLLRCTRRLLRVSPVLPPSSTRLYPLQSTTLRPAQASNRTPFPPLPNGLFPTHLPPPFSTLGPTRPPWPPVGSTRPHSAAPKSTATLLASSPGFPIPHLPHLPPLWQVGDSRGES